MPIEKLPAGTRGARTPPALLGRLMTPVLLRAHRRAGDRFQGMDLLYLTTVGARSGASRTTPVARFDDGDGGWFIVASAGGTAEHPAWYHNVVAHPDQVQVEVAGIVRRVQVDQLDGEERVRAWARVVERVPRFATYLTKTDRTLPLLHLVPIS